MSHFTALASRMQSSVGRASWLGLVLAMMAAVGLTSAPRAAGAAPVSAAGLEFTFAEVGDLGGAASFALDIAPDGTVVGTASSSSASRPQVAFVDDGATRSLGTLPGSTFSRAMGVNARGTVVGEAFTAGAESSRAVTWDRFGRLRVLPGLGGPDSSAVANAVNLRGDVAGVSSGPDGRATAVVWPLGRAPRPLRWLADVPGAVSRAWDLDLHGTVVGSAAAAEDGDDHLHTHAVLWDRTGRVRDLGVLEDHGRSVAYAVAHHGGPRPLVVGEASLSGGSRAVVFTPGGPTALPTPGDYRYARATDVARNGSVVGHAARFQGAPTFGGVAVLWWRGKAYPLADLVRDLPPGWSLQTAEGIDDRGRIAGYGTVNGQIRAFLLTPMRSRP
jgi:uncharacterized membrane protein